MADPEYMVFIPGAPTPPSGPMTLVELQAAFQAGRLGSEAKVATVGGSEWLPIGSIVLAQSVPPAAPDAGGPFEVTLDGEHVVGPVSLDQLRRGLEAGKVPGDAKARLTGSVSWLQVTDVVTLQSQSLAPLAQRAVDLTTPVPVLQSQKAGDKTEDFQRAAWKQRWKTKWAAIPTSRLLLIAGVGFASALLVIALLGPSEGRWALWRAKSLEDAGNLAEAAEVYDTVDGLHCSRNVSDDAANRAAEIRCRLANNAIKEWRFATASSFLTPVTRSGISKYVARAKETLDSTAFKEGIRWEKALDSANRGVALADMEAVEAANVPVSAKATEWLTKERPVLLLEDAQTACGRPVSKCIAICDRLIGLHPATLQAARAAELRTAYKDSESRRIYPLLVQAEKLMRQCVEFWRKDKARSDCTLQALAMNPDNPLAALVMCPENNGKPEEKLNKSFEKLVDDIGDPAVVRPLRDRYKQACDDGEYEAMRPPQPAASNAVMNDAASPAAGGLTPAPGATPPRQASGGPCNCAASDMMCRIRCKAQR